MIDHIWIDGVAECVDIARPKRCVDRVIEPLGSAGVRVLALDLPGHGTSAKDVGDGSTGGCGGGTSCQRRRNSTSFQ